MVSVLLYRCLAKSGFSQYVIDSQRQPIGNAYWTLVQTGSIRVRLQTSQGVKNSDELTHKYVYVVKLQHITASMQ